MVWIGLVERTNVRAWIQPQASIVDRGVLESEPQGMARRWIGVQERAVNVWRHLAANVRLLEDVHRLHERRLGDTDHLRRDLLHQWLLQEALEHWISSVKCCW